MVIRFIFLMALWPIVLFSGEFTADIKRNKIGIGETVTLSLTLKDASPTSSPSIAHLKTSFNINSQQQSSSTTYVNGRMTSSITWKINLTPISEGNLQIPAITVETKEGSLSTKPINIIVSQEHNKSSDPSNNQGIVFNGSVSNEKPYKNETISYSVKLTSKHELANVSLQQFNVENAIVEHKGDPKVSRDIVDGVRVLTIEHSYSITPIKAGQLKIPPLVIQGGIPTAQNSRFGSLFEDDFEPFFGMGGFQRLKPFSIATNEIVLDVKPAMPEVNPWLPAKSLIIEEIWNDNQVLQVGEPITRAFKISAKGIMANQLPSLKDFQIDDRAFKIYSDKPETSEEYVDGNVYSLRKEQYTLIPQESGSKSLPELTIAWWDTVNEKRAVSTIPARNLQILPALATTQSQGAIPEDAAMKNSGTQGIDVQRDPTLYVIMGVMSLMFLGAVFWGISLQRKLLRLTESKPSAKEEKPKPVLTTKTAVIAKKAVIPKKDKNEKLPDLNPT